MKQVKNLINLLIVFLLTTMAKAGNETMSNRIGGNQIVNNASVSVQDSRYPNVELTGTAKVVKASSKVIFSIDMASPVYYSTYNKVRLGLRINSWDKNGAPQLIPTIVELEVGNQTGGTYTDKSVYVIDGSHKVTATIQYFKDPNGVIIPPASVPLNLALEVEQTTERYYQFNTTVTPVLSIDSTDMPSLNEMIVRWDAISGAEEYELEWTYTNDYELTAATVPINFDNNATRVRLSKNDYRVTMVFDKGYVVWRVRGIGRSPLDHTKEIYTNWSAADAGFASSYSNQHYYRVYTNVRHETKKNWQYSSSYAEDGKKKEVVSYFDGSLRNRQSVTKSNTTQQTIVGETIYDYQGRPAIQVLPVPTAQSKIKYYSGFNRREITGTIYNRKDFDLDTDTTLCTPPTKAMDSTLMGSAYYYSESNADKAGFQSYTPNSHQYPFTQTEYTPDNTGRVRRQGGVGKEFQLGTGRETKYFYGQPEQVQLDRLFGSEVGDYRHYKKNMVVDANGQISVSYLDQAGRTVATSLAGNTPTNVTALPGPDPATSLSIDYIKSSDPLVPNSNKFINNALVFSKELTVATAGVYQFTYDMQAPKYQDALCMNAPLCFDCIYDLEISIKDACGVNMTTPVKQTVGTLDTICGSALTFILTPTPLNVTLPVGNYTILKRLTINEKAIDFYTEKYAKYANATCVTPFSTFLSQAMTKIDTTACEMTCAQCVASLGSYASHSDYSKGNPASPTYDPLYKYLTQDQFNEALRRCNAPCQPANLCEAQYQTLLADVSPSGQYAKYTTDASGNFVSTDPVSVLNTSNSLPVSGTASNWRNPKLIVINPATLAETVYNEYRDEDNTRTRIIVVKGPSGTYSPAIIGTTLTDANGNEYVYPENLSNTLDFINLFGSHPNWAKSLVSFHPEYPYYKWCSRNSDTLFSSTGTKKLTSDSFDDRIRQINSYAVAVANLLTDNNLSNPTDLLVKDPYFETSSAAAPNHGQGEALRPQMVSLVTNYGSVSGPSLKGFCAIAVRCGTQYYGTQPATCDDYGTGSAIDSIKRNQEWVLYRNMYLAEKQKLQQRASEMYAASQNRCNNCIGIKDGPFNPWTGGTTSFFDANTPCGAFTFQLYKEKVKRFQNAGDAYTQSGLDPNASQQDALNTLVNNTEYKMYQETGQCGITNDMGFLLDAMATKGLLTTTGTALSTIPSFTKRLYDAIIYPTTPSSTTFLDYTWKATVTGTNLKIQFGNGSGTFDECEINLTIPAGNSWANVKRFNMIKYVNTAPAGTYNFTITAYVDASPPNPPTQVTVTGSTCINLTACSFPNNCGPSETAYQITNLLSALAANAKLTTANVDVKASPYGNLFYNNLIPPSSGTLSAVWNGTSNGSGCSLVVNGTSCTFNLAFVNAGYSFSNVAYFQNLRLNSGSPNTSFTVDAWVSGQFQPVTVTMSMACYNFQKCAPPPNRCTGPEYRNNDLLTAGLNTIANQGKLLKNFSLSTMPDFAKMFGFVNLSKSFWIIKNHNPTAKSLLVHLKEWNTGTDTTKRDSIYVVYKNPANTHTYANIVSFNDLQVQGYSFTIVARFSDNTTEVLVGTRPKATLAKCEACTDYVLDYTVTKDGDCECNNLSYPNSSSLNGGTALSNSSCAEGFKISANNTCATWPIGSSHSGKFLAVHYNGADAMIWKQVMNPTVFIAGQTYRFKIWYKRMTGTFDLILKVTHSSVVTTVKTVNVTPGANPVDGWFEAFGDWTAPSGNLGVVSIEVAYHRVDTGTDTYFGLDEMSMQRLSPCNGTFKDPYIIPYVNPCVKNLKDIAKANAIESYNAYIRGIKLQFRENYLSTCKNALENLKMVYTDKEYHFTLYYYDQAGNLIKTVPPEGVVKVTTPADFTQIAQDRFNKTQTYFTKHTLKTRYEYNALNQLIRQATPDQDLMNKWKLNGAVLIPSTTNIYGMAFSNGNNGFVVGDNGSGAGVIYTTTDGGKTWSQVSSLGVGNLQDVQFIGTTGYAISDRGELVKTTNGGTNWSIVSTPTGQKLNDIYFSSATAGVIVGNAGTILKTSNGGTSWDAVTVDPAATPGIAISMIDLNDLHFTSATTGYIAGSKGAILRTTNSGANWAALPGITNPLNNSVKLNAIHFISATSGYVAGVDPATGQGIIALATINVGQTATTFTYPTINPIAANCEFKTIYGVDANNVFAGGTNGKLYAVSTSSAGAFNAYTISGITGTPEITELTFPDAGNPYIGHGSMRNGQRIKSTYSGGLTSWTASNVTAGSLTNPAANGVYFEPSTPQTGYLATDGGSVLKTTNGGTSWSTLSNYTLPILEDVAMIPNTTTGYAVGRTGSIIKTVNSGSTWTNVTPTGTTNDLKAAAFESTTTGMVVGMGGKILRVTGGATVTTISTAPAITNDFYDVVQLASPASTYIAVGSSGKVVTGNSSSASWTSNTITSVTAQTLYSVYFVGSTGYAVGAGGAIIKTINNGSSWTALSSGVSTVLREVYFKDQLTGYAMGDGGTILKTVDGGANWKLQPGTGTGNFYAANFTNDGKAIIGGTSASGSANMANLNDESNDYGTRFWYDRLGRMVISQNSKQFNKATPAYTYTKYDAQGRITEVGEIATTTDVAATMANEHGVVFDDNMFKNWVVAGTRTEVTTTVYDASVMNVPLGFQQENLRKRVSATYIDNDGNLGNGYTHSSIYSYDIHGNVKTLIQDITALNGQNQRYKKIDYHYDLVSGVVSKVCYQAGEKDQFYHKYEYDAENRITRAFTSKDGIIWDQDAKYFYYHHGPLARIELAEDKIHASDYVYTLQGWIKGVNSNTLNTTRDPGKDGTTGTQYISTAPDIHAKIGRDVYGYSLAYYDATGIKGDYNAINSTFNQTANDFEIKPDVSFSTATTNLYNGNIKRMTSTFYDIDPSSPNVGQASPMLSNYKYDQLNRLLESKSFRSFDLTNNVANTTYDQAYESIMTYDANGNILTMKANGKPGNLNMDQMTYKYDWINPAVPSEGKRSNRLYHVNDISSTYNTDIDDQGTFTPAASNNLSIINTSNNYGYDELGNLKRDNQEQIANIDWNAYGKMKSIQRTSGSTKAALDFSYDAAGNRLSKKSTTSSGYTTAIYVRDVKGNILATYEISNASWGYVNPKEYTVYGSARLGVAMSYTNPVAPASIYTRNRKNKQYELSNHLGNILTTIYDRKVSVDVGSNGSIDYYTAYVTSTSDYYAFGAPLPGRVYTSTDAYRYGFNGKEKDDDVKGIGNSYNFEARIYDPRLGRWLSLDPSAKNYPNWSPYNYSFNNPIVYNDPDGKDPITAILEGVTAFGIEAGLDFMTSMIVKGKDAKAAFDGINWQGAAFEGGKAFAISIFLPTGSQTAARLAKMSQSVIGKLTMDFVANLSSEVMKNYVSGKYNDEDGDFDFDKLQEDFINVTYTAAITTFMEAGMGDKAKELYDKVAKSNSKLAKQYEKLFKNLDSSGSTAKTIENRVKKVDDAAKELATNAAKATAAKTGQETAKKTADEIQKKVRGVKEEEPVKKK